MGEVQSDHRHHECLCGEDFVLGKPQHEALEHLVGHRHSSVPQGPSEGEGRGLAAPRLVVLREGRLQKIGSITAMVPQWR